MAGTILFLGFGLTVSFVLYCCIRVGALEDRRMEELEKRKKDAGRKTGETRVCKG